MENWSQRGNWILQRTWSAIKKYANSNNTTVLKSLVYIVMGKTAKNTKNSYAKNVSQRPSLFSHIKSTSTPIWMDKVATKFYEWHGRMTWSAIQLISQVNAEFRRNVIFMGVS